MTPIQNELGLIKHVVSSQHNSIKSLFSSGFPTCPVLLNLAGERRVPPGSWIN